MSKSTLTRLGTLALGAALAAASFAPAAGQTRKGGVFYTAELCEPASETSVVAGGVAWRCEGARCVAPRSNDRPLRVCTELRREVGTVASFMIGGEALDSETLGRCNG